MHHRLIAYNITGKQQNHAAILPDNNKKAVHVFSKLRNNSGAETFKGLLAARADILRHGTGLPCQPVPGARVVLGGAGRSAPRHESFTFRTTYRRRRRSVVWILRRNMRQAPFIGDVRWMEYYIMSEVLFVVLPLQLQQ